MIARTINACGAGVMFEVDWVQHAVGHGGFHTGEARADGSAPFRWAFDCGAKRTAQFDEYLKAWLRTQSGPLDWLFLSHFDTDHVSGLETLLSRLPVRDVMVPYLNDRELALTLLYEIGRDRLDRWFVDLVADPAEYFLSRGVERVTFLQGRRPDREAFIERPPEGDPRKDDRGWMTRLRPKPTELPPPNARAWISGLRPRVGMVEDLFDINLTHARFGLRLTAYRAPITLFQHKGLRAQLKALVGATYVDTGRPGLGDLAYAIAGHARTPAGRKALRGLFKAWVGSSNRASLSLLSIPEPPNASDGWHSLEPHWPYIGEGAAAWLNTGDAELLTAGDLADWAARFASDLDSVRMLALPHHGSDNNSDSELQKSCPHALLAVHVKAGSKKHPGDMVSACAGKRLTHVTNDPTTAVRLEYRWP